MNSSTHKSGHRNEAIGVFDSGVGGLTVVDGLLRHMPNEKIIYFGDTARVPYGSKSAEAITGFAIEIMNFLLSKNVKAIVVACNTVSATCLDRLKEISPVPVFGVVRPGVEAAKAANVKKIGVIGTERTVNSGAYERLILDNIDGAEVYQRACPLFVPLAEEGFVSGEITRLAVSHYLSDFFALNIDALILGCTHYPILYDAINDFFCGKIKLIDPADTLSLYMKSFLREKSLDNTDTSAKTPVFYASDKTAKFPRLSKLILGREYDLSYEC